MYSVQLQMIRIKDGNEEQEDPDVDIFNISQNVQDIVIHLEVDEEQLLLFLTFNVLVANPKKLLYTMANPARGLLNREKRTK